MTNQTGSGHGTFITEEETYGVPFATPAFDPVCVSANSVGAARDPIIDDCLSPIGQVRSLALGPFNIAGDLVGSARKTAYDLLLESALQGEFSGDVLIAERVRKSFTIEKQFNDIDVTENHRFSGCEVSAMSLSATAAGPVPVTFTMIGQSINSGTFLVQLAGATYAPEVSVDQFTSMSGSITEGGGASAVVSSFDLTISRNMEQSFVIGQDVGIQGPSALCDVTGTITAFYKSDAIYQKFLNETESSIVIELTDGAGSSWSINLPRIKYTGGNPDISGPGQVEPPFTFQALTDDGIGSNIEITRVTV